MASQDGSITVSSNVYPGFYTRYRSIVDGIQLGVWDFVGEAGEVALDQNLAVEAIKTEWWDGANFHAAVISEGEVLVDVREPVIKLVIYTSQGKATPLIWIRPHEREARAYWNGQIHVVHLPENWRGMSYRALIGVATWVLLKDNEQGDIWRDRNNRAHQALIKLAEK